MKKALTDRDLGSRKYASRLLAPGMPIRRTTLKVSFTLPTLFPDAIHRAIANINASVREVDYEILVVSPFPVEGPRVVWVEEGEPRGNCGAHAMAFEKSTGDVVAPMCDDVLLLPGAVEKALRFMMEREVPNPDYVLGLAPHSQMMGTAFGIYYPYFPMLRRSTAARIGGYYRTCFRSHFGDVDIGLRAWDAGGRCEATPFPVLHFLEVHDDFSKEQRTKAQRRDMETFLSLWAVKYGSEWDCSEVEKFNMDMPPLMQLIFKENHTIYLNHPIVRAIFQRVHANMAGRQAFLHIGDPEAP